MPATPVEWALAVPVGLLAVAIPLALVVWLWPVIMAAGWLGVAMFFVVLAAGLFISGLCLWLGAPLVVLTALLLAGLFSALRGLSRIIRR